MATTLRKLDFGNILKLDGTNYRKWRMQVQCVLTSYGLWDIANGNEKAPAADADADDKAKWLKKDNDAKAVIMLSMSSNQLDHLVSCTTSEAMFDKLEQVYDDTSAVNIQQTLTKFYTYKHSPDQSPIKTYTDLQEIASCMKELGCPVEDIALVTRIVTSLPNEKYFAFRQAWQSIDTGNQTMTRLLARLKELELSMKNEEQDLEAVRAFMTKPNHKKPFHPKEKHESKEKIQSLKERTKCHRCGQKGHWKSECRNKKEEKHEKSEKPKEPKPNGQTGRAFIGLSSHDQKLRNNWISDSGASAHFCGRREWFKTYEEYDEPRPASIANNGVMHVLGQGTVEVEALIKGKWYLVPIHDVNYIPNAVNLFSENVMIKKGYTIFKEGDMTYYFQNGSRKLGGPVAQLEDDGVQYMRFQRPKEERLVALSANAITPQRWHERLAHVNTAYLQETVDKDAVYGLDDKLKFEKNFNCETCKLAKSTRKPFPARTKESKILPGQMAHADLAGKFPHVGIGGANYFLLIKDEVTGYREVYFLKYKDEAARYLIHYIRCIQKSTGNEFLTLRTDNGGEFICQELQKFLEENAISHEKSAPYCPETNGVIEREMRTVKEAARTMLLNAKAPEFLWSEAVGTAVYILNRLLSKRSPDKTPYERIYGKKPTLSHVRTFGCIAYVHVDKVKRSAWDPSAKKCILVGYDFDKRYRLYDEDSGKILHERNVTFVEEVDELIVRSTEEDFEPPPCKLCKVEQPPVAKPKEGADPDPDGEPEPDFEPEEGDEEGIDDDEDVLLLDTEMDDLTLTEEVIDLDNDEDEEANAVDNSLFSLPEEPTPSSSTSEGPSSSKGKSKLKITFERKGQAPKEFKAEVLEKRLRDRKPKQAHMVRQINEPNSYQEAKDGPEQVEWIDAMNSEIESHMINGTWVLVEKTPTMKILDSRWVFKVKMNTDESIASYKARLVIRGFRQQHGIDYEETFSSVCRCESIRVLLCLAASENLHIKQFDVKTAFLHGELKEEIYMHQPEGYVTHGDDYVCLLKKSLYGLKQAPRC